MNRFSYLELVILRMLSSEQMHGYAMSAAMQQYSDGMLQLPAGSLYPALHKLERTNLITSALEQLGGRKRRIYSITERGKVALEEEIRSWHVMVKTMNTLLEVH